MQALASGRLQGRSWTGVVERSLVRCAEREQIGLTSPSWPPTVWAIQYWGSHRPENVTDTVAPTDLRMVDVSYIP